MWFRGKSREFPDFSTGAGGPVFTDGVMSVAGSSPTVPCPQGHRNAWNVPFCAVCGTPIGVLEWPSDVAEPVSSRRLLAASVVVIAVLIVAGIAAFVVFAPLSRDNADQSTDDRFAVEAPAAVPSGPVICPAPPTIRAESMSMRREGLAVEAAFMSPCPGEPIEADGELRVTVADGQRDIAAAVFDFASYPLALEPGVPARRTLVFTHGMYWRTPDMVSVTPTVTAHRGAATVAEVTPPRTSGFDMLLASAPALPEHGSVDGVARAVLRELRGADYTHALQNLANRWVPQISSTKTGRVVDGVTVTAAEVLQDHLALRHRFAGARLIWSGHWTTFDSPDWWVTVVGPPRLSPQDANRWCDANGFGVDDCFAKLISSVSGAEGTTVYRN